MIDAKIQKATIEAAIENLGVLLVMADVIQGNEDNEDYRIKEREAFDHIDKTFDLMSEVLADYEKN